MRQSLLLFFVFGAFSSFAQVSNLQLSVAPNYTIIPSVETTHSVQPLNSYYGYLSLPVQVGSVRESFKGKPGISLAFHGDYKFTSRFFITTGLGIDYYRFQRTLKITSLSYQDNDAVSSPWATGFTYAGLFQGSTVGQPYGQIRAADLGGLTVGTPSDDAGKTSLICVQIPVMAGTSFFKEKLRVSAGSTFSAVVHATEITTVYDGPNGGFKDKTIDNKGDFQTFSISGVVSVSYHLTKHFAVNTTGTKSFSSLYSKENHSGGTARMNAISVGVRYIIR
jgi:hypothetical protein